MAAFNGFASNVGRRAWRQSVQGAVATWSTMGVENHQEYRMLITDQVATAPCTDRFQARRPTFEAKRDFICYHSSGGIPSVRPLIIAGFELSHQLCAYLGSPQFSSYLRSCR